MIANLLLAATAVFVQAQLKYGAERDDFLHRWYERPLHQNSAWKTNGKDFLNVDAWKLTAKTLREGGFDGVAYFSSSLDARRDVVLKRSLEPGGETGVLFELAGYSGFEKCVTAAGRALKQPNAYRIGGKTVLPLRGDKAVVCSIEFLDRMSARLKQEYGESFLIVPFTGLFPREDREGDHLAAGAPERLKENLRQLLRHGDGAFLNEMAIDTGRRYDARFFDTAIVPLVRSVYDEPEFAGKKILGCFVAGGHENTYRWQYVKDCGGTQRLADTFSSMLKLRPDFLICCEWDEENENSFFRPTLYNGQTTERMVHWFSAAANGKAPTPYQNEKSDDPNLIVSYRKALTAGETIEAEVRNVPDGSFAGETFQIGFCWRDAKGAVVKRFAEQSLAANEMSAVRFATPAVEGVANRFLRPELTVRTAKAVKVYADGFYPLGLNATRTVDHKWVKQSLRELATGVTGELAIGEKDATGVYTVRGRVSSQKKLRSVEVLDDMDTVYLHTPTPEIPAGYDLVRLQLAGHGSQKAAETALTGTVSFVHAPGARLRPFVEGKRRLDVTGTTWTARNVRADNWGVLAWALVPTNEMTTGEIIINLLPHEAVSKPRGRDALVASRMDDLSASDAARAPRPQVWAGFATASYFKGRIPLKDLLATEAVGLNGPFASGLTVMRYFAPTKLPPPLMEKAATFTFRWKPLEKTSLLRLQTVDEDYRLWRGPAETICRPSGKSVTLHVYDRGERRTMPLTIDAARVENPSCDFTKATTAALQLGSGRALSGMVGATAAIAQGFGWGESQYGNSLKRQMGRLSTKVLPTSGWGCLSHQVVPCFAGFALEMVVVPHGLDGRQGLFGSGNCGVDLALENGVPVARLSEGVSFFELRKELDVAVRGPKLVDGVENRVRLVTDRHQAWIEVNGVSGEKVPYADYFPNQRYSLYGASHPKGDFFRGEIKSLKVDCL